MGITNTQYNTIMRDYQRQQAKNQQDLADRTAEIYGRFPQFSEIDARIASASTSCARAMLLDGADCVGPLRTQVAALAARKTELLLAGGYPADYLEMKYRCPDCQDTGYIGTEKCHCFRQAIIDLLYTQSNLREILKEENFQAFSLDYYSDRILDPVTESLL